MYKNFELKKQKKFEEEKNWSRKIQGGKKYLKINDSDVTS